MTASRRPARHAACSLCVTSESGHSKPRARLRRARWTGITASAAEEALCVRGTRCALLCRLPPRVAVSQSHAAGVRGKWASPIQHNRALFAAAPVVRYALLVGRPRITGGYVLRPCRLPCVPLRRTHSTAGQCTRGFAASAFVWSRATRRCGVGGFSPAHPRSRSRGSRCAARSRASVPAPVRPRWGLP